MPVVDASVVVDWVAPGVRDVPAMALLRRMTERDEALVAPRLLLEEVANALLTGVRRRRWTGAAADVAFELLRQLPVTLVDEPADLARAWDLSRRYDEHPVYDTLYVAVAQRLHQRLVTADDALRRRLSSLPFLVAPDGF